MYILLEYLVREDNGHEKWEDNERVVENGIVDERELEEVVDSKSKEKEHDIEAYKKRSLRMQEEVNFFAEKIHDNDGDKADNDKQKRSPEAE